MTDTTESSAIAWEARGWRPFTPDSPEWEERWEAFRVALLEHPDGASSTIYDYMAMEQTVRGIAFKHKDTRRYLFLSNEGSLS